MVSNFIDLPLVSGGGGGGGISSLNGQTGSSQTFATGTTGTNFAISSAGNIHTFNLPVASGTNTRKLSSTDWTTFNNKEPAFTTIPISKGGTNSGTASDFPREEVGDL